ncbi:unnamed protein product [Dovyalis caffra]|uniref:Uncharacterized protein n=1 Tax=Dovyalis caffra TaxID=77055 RepID=A0AAV1R7M6_9ROSI|nr:unnamed protein product [Dovyalis caffra]
MSVELRGLPLLKIEDLPSFVLPLNPFDSFPRLFCDMFQNMKKYRWVIGNSFSELKKDVVESMVDLSSYYLRLRANQDEIVSNEEVKKCIREIMDIPKSEEVKSNAKELKIEATDAIA